VVVRADRIEEIRRGIWDRRLADALVAGGNWSEQCPACAGTGSSLMARVQLAAYCRDETARAIAPAREWSDAIFADWARGLAKWADVGPAPGWVLTRAAVAAARTVPTRGRVGAVAGWGEETVGVFPSTAADHEWNARAIFLAGQLAGAEITRAAIERALVDWALA
jgi:hypothetical protein